VRVTETETLAECIKVKLLFENWREFVKQEVEEFLPHGEVRAVEKIGSSVLPPKEQAKQDLEKYGYVRDEDDRDIDVEVEIAGITNEEAEEWAFSREAQELEDYYNYDVQLRIVENWRKFMNEGIFYVRTTQLLPSEELGHGKNDEGYDTEQAVAEKMQQIQQGKLEPIEVCNQKPVNPYRLADKSMEKSGQAEPFYYVLDGHHRLEAINRLGVERVPVYLTNKEINEAMSEDVDPKMKKYLKKHPYMEPDQLQEEAAGQCFPFAVEMANAVPDDEFNDMSKFKVVHGRITDKFSGETTLHAWVEKGDVVFDWQTSATKPKGISKVSYYDIFQPEVHAEYTAEELLVNCMKQGHKGPFNLPEESEFQTKMKKNLPAELDFLLNKGPNNKKEGPGVKNPKKPKFKSAPPGAEGG